MLRLYTFVVTLWFSVFLTTVIQWKPVIAESNITTTVTSTVISSVQSTPPLQPSVSLDSGIWNDSTKAILLNIIPALIIGVISAGATYFFGIRQLRYQLEVELRNEYELTRQRLKADLEKEYQSRFNERKWELYVKFANIVRRQIESIKLPKDKQPKELQNVIKELYGFVGELWIIGNDNVVEAFNIWRRTSLGDNNSTEHAEKLKPLVDLMQIVIEMRRDLGYESSQIKPEDLLRTFINDLAEQTKQTE